VVDEVFLEIFGLEEAVGQISEIINLGKGKNVEKEEVLRQELKFWIHMCPKRIYTTKRCWILEKEGRIKDRREGGKSRSYKS
jgi:hypothetical protein